MKKYKIVGPCAVLGVQPGGTVTHEALEEAGANIGALVGFHLEPLEPDGQEQAEETRPPARRKAAS